MAVDFTVRYSTRVKVLPRATLVGGTEVNNYAEAMVVDVIGISGDYNHTIGAWVNFVSPSQKDPEGYVGWNSLSAGPLPDFAKTAAASWTGSVTADVVSGIESQFNAPVDDYVPEWAG